MTTRAWVAFAVVGLVWGLPYLFIKIAIDEGLSPTFIAWSRVVIATAILLPVGWWLGALRGLRGKLVPLLAIGGLEIVGPFPLIAAGEQYVSSSLAAILIATVPLIIALLAIRFDADERVRGPRLIGLVVGLAGVIILLGIDVAGRPDELLGAGMIILAAVGYAAAPLILKRSFRGVAPLTPVIGALAVGSVVLAPVGLLTAPPSMPTGTALIAIGVLGVVCSAIAFVAFFTLIGEAGPSRASIITYVNPAVAVALGVTLLGEQVGIGMAAGLALILAGSWLATGGRLPRRREGAASGQPAAQVPRNRTE